MFIQSQPINHQLVAAITFSIVKTIKKAIVNLGASSIKIVQHENKHTSVHLTHDRPVHVHINKSVHYLCEAYYKCHTRNWVHVTQRWYMWQTVIAA